MILVFKKGVKYTTSNGSDNNLFPIMELPLDKRGEEAELNDFQWWSYTEDWNKWLKKNPREWQAESLEGVEEFSYERLLESLLERNDRGTSLINERLANLTEDGRFVNFGRYNNLLEANSDAGSKGALKKYVKLGYAISGLFESGEMKENLNIEDLEEGKSYGVVITQIDDEGNSNPSSIQVVKITTLNERGEVILAKLDESVPLGKIDDPGTFVQDTHDYTQEVVGGLLAVGSTYLILTYGVGAYLTYKTFKTVRGIYGKGKNKATMSLLKYLFNKATGKTAGKAASKPGMAKGAFTALKTWAKSGGKKVVVKNAFKVAGKQTGSAFMRRGTMYSLKTGKKLGQTASRAAFKTLGASKGVIGKTTAKLISKIAAKGAGKVAIKTLARVGLSSNPVGWVIMGGMELAGGIQRIFNWTGSNQAPTYSKVDDFAFKKFNPGEIQSGKPITVCWTMDEKDALAGVTQTILNISTDTRTTMDLVKIGEFDDRSIFILANVNSKSYEKLLKHNDLIMLAFDNSDVFERGILDNDDLEFETIVIPDMTQYTWPTLFGGYCDWDAIKDAYQNAPSTPYMVPQDAKTTYEFNYKNDKGDDINVKGTLIDQSALDSMNIADLFPTLATAEINEGEDFDDITSKSLYSFDSFNISILEKEDDEKKEEEEFKTNDAWTEEYVKNTEGSDKIELDYDQCPVIAYKVDMKSFVDPDKNGKIGTYDTFIVGVDSLDPTQNSPVSVEVTSMDPVIDPRYGLIEFEAKPEENKIEDEEVDKVEIDPIEREEDADEGGKVVKTTKGDVRIKERKNSLTIKDEDVTGGINTFGEFASDDLKRELGLDILGWKEITSAKIRYGREEEPIRVILKNRHAKAGDRILRIKKGETGFKEAVNFVKAIENGIEYK